MANILNETYFDLNNWTKNMTSFPLFQNDCSNGINTLNYQGGSAFERIYIPITVENNRNYQFKFHLHSPTGFTMGGYGHDYAFAFIRTTAPNDTDGAITKTNLACSDNWDASASDVPKQYTISFNSSNYTTLYVALDFGYIIDGVTSQFVFSNFELQESSANTIGIECMPIMKDVNTCFDARVGVGQTEWENLVGNTNLQLFNPIKTNDGVEFVGSENSYGKLTIPWKSGSSRTWYFIFKNTSGVFTDWRTIIGNESAEYKCSTLAMDGNGYIKFTRPNIIPSTSLGFKCSDWHVVAWTSNASDSRTRLWIDGTYINYASKMQGWSDDTYLARGSGWWYEDNNTVFRAIAIADSAHTDAEVVSNSKWLYDNYVTNYTNSFFEVKYLIRSNHSLYTIIDGTLTALQETVVESSLFNSKGFNELPDSSLLLGLYNPEILYWQSSTEDELPTMTVTMTATPSPQVLIAEPFYMIDSTILGIESVICEYTGEPLIALSFDSGNFEYYDGANGWVVASESEGMIPSVLTAITTDTWSERITDVQSIQIRVILNSADDSLANIKFNFINQ